MSVFVDRKTGALRMQYTDWTGKRVSVTAPETMTKKQANGWFIKTQCEHDEIRRGIRPPPRIGSKKPISEITAEYLAWGNAQGGKDGRPWSKAHSQERPKYLKYWMERLNIQVADDLNGKLAEVEAALRDLKKLGVGRVFPSGTIYRKPLSGKTLNEYGGALMSFCRWCRERGYLDKNPFEGLTHFNPTPITHRRALTAEEVGRLLTHCRPEKALIYELAIFTGLRANELRQLTVADLDVARGGVRLHAAWTKNRKDGIQYIPTSLVDRLVTASGGRGASDKLLDQFPRVHTARMVEMDLELAGLKKWGVGGKVDFHSLRVTYTTLVCGAGADIKELQTMVRHSNPSLTMNTYARAREERLAALIEKVGETIEKSRPQEMKAAVG